AAELAAIHLLRSFCRSRALYSPAPGKADEFFRLVLEAAFGFFGSLVLNPKRKCDLPEDHRERLRRINRGHRETFPWEKEARRLALAFLRDCQAPPMRALVAGRIAGPAVMMAARYLGRIYGKRLHHAMIAGKIGPGELRGIFLGG